jgi:lysophospholipase L1-like esterase
VRNVPRAVVVAVATTLLLAASGVPASAATYVGLGDSAASGPVIPNQIPAPLGCWRSDHDFAHVAAQSLATSLKDVSCSGAKTDNMWSAQNVFLGPNPPQFDALTNDARLVTLQIGGNDIGFGEIRDACTTASPYGHPCRDRYAPNWPEGQDVLADRIAATAPKVAAVLQAIHERAPAARVLVVGYAAILPDTGYGCWPQVAFAWQDVPYLRATHKALNAVLAAQAADHNATYVDAYSASIGRDACQSYFVRWVEPTVPLNPAAPLHPNARGMRGIAATVLSAIGMVDLQSHPS